MSAEISLQLPDGPEQRFPWGRAVTLGRDAASDFVLLDSRASRHHAVLTPGEGGDWIFEDRSANGTFANGTRIDRLRLVQPVTLRIGHPAEGTELAVRPTPANQPARPTPLLPLQPAPRPPLSAPSPPPALETSVSAAAFSRVHEPAGRTTRVGRGKDNEIVLEDLLVSRHHAEVRAEAGGGYSISDLGSHNGTFVNGQRITRRTPVDDGVLVSIGHHLLRLHEGRLEEYVDTGAVNFAALGVTVEIRGKKLLDEVSFALGAGNFLAVLGPTGAGKSTLLKALTGYRPADRGQVFYNGRDLYQSYAELRNRLGYVPQDDILHPQLTVRAALSYAAELRFAVDVSEADREARVAEVMSELGLTERAELQVGKLSGGQRKRTSVAIELLTRPSLLFLDEPTSGLDPGYEKSVMDLLRSLADGGRTVVTVTHSIQSLDRCDRVLFLAPGGQTAYFGPPDEVLPFFHQPQYADVFLALDRAAPGSAKAAFAGSQPQETYVTQPLEAQVVALRAAGVPPASAPEARDNQKWVHQLVTLLRRYVAVTMADRRNTALLLAQAPVLGILMYVVFGHGNLQLASSSRGFAGTVIVGLILGSAYLGASNSIREIVKERPILIRERAVGLSASAYVLSKAIVLGVLTIIQAVILVALGTARSGGPIEGSFLHSGRLELYLAVSLTGLAAMALGLLISAFVNNADKALTLLPVILFAQFLLTGSVFPLQGTPVLNQIGYLAGSRWGYSAIASTVDLDSISGTGCNGAPKAPPQPVDGPSHLTGPVPEHPNPGVSCDFAHHHAGAILLLDSFFLILLTFLPLVGAWLALRPVGQPQRREPGNKLTSWLSAARGQ